MINTKFLHKNKAKIIISICAIVLIAYSLKNASLLIRSVSAIGFIVLFFLIDYLFRIKFKVMHYVFIFIISISSFLLSNLYYIYPQYDKIQHFFQPIMFAIILMYMVDRLELDYIWKSIFVFFIIIGCLGLFEIGEYLLDSFFNLKLQGVFLRSIQGLEKFDILMDRIDDTMIDMIIGTIGTAVYSIAEFFYKSRKKKSVKYYKPKILTVSQF